MIDVRRSDATGNADNCSDIHQGKTILDAIAKLNPQNIILIGRWSLYVHGMRNSDGVLQTDTHFVTTDPNGQATAETGEAAFRENFLPTVQALSKIAKVLIIKNVPVLKKPVTSAFTIRVSWYQKDDISVIKPTLAEHLELSRIPYSMIDEAGKLPNVNVFDPTPFLCSNVCEFVKDGINMYRDDNHPSSRGSLELKEQIYHFL